MRELMARLGARPDAPTRQALPCRADRRGYSSLRDAGIHAQQRLMPRANTGGRVPFLILILLKLI